MGWWPCCCSPCTYESSDGGLYSNTFGAALDAGWNQVGGTDVTFATSGGKLQAAGNVLGQHSEGIYREDTLPGGWTKIIVEVDVNRLDSDTINSSIQLIKTDATNIAVLQARWSAGDFRLQAGSTSEIVSQTPSDGDKLTMIIEPDPDSNYNVCFFVNEVQIGLKQVEGTVSIADPFRHGVNLTLGVADTTFGQFDNYTSQLDS